mmetsp:Transcript_42278/g.98645  ORF Transcript_42278/g.98645 Transcript_42278/m.98645 type:complete len:142 (-) Transcript_42278:80-505(-)
MAAAPEPEESEPLSEDAPDRPTLAEWMKQNEDLEMAEVEWYAPAGVGTDLPEEKREYPREYAFQKRYWKKYGKEYYTKDNYNVPFRKESVDIPKARKAAAKAAATATEALPSQPEAPFGMGTFAGAALVGLLATARGRQRR